MGRARLIPALGGISAELLAGSHRGRRPRSWPPRHRGARPPGASFCSVRQACPAGAAMEAPAGPPLCRPRPRPRGRQRRGVAASRPPPAAVADPGRHALGCPGRRRRQPADEFLHVGAAPFPAAELALAHSPQIGQRPPPGSGAALRFLRPFPCSGIPLLLLPAALGPVAAMETFTSGTLEALNGTDVRLKCTFRSPVPVGPKLTVSWYFQSELKEPLEAVSHAQPPCPVVRWQRGC